MFNAVVLPDGRDQGILDGSRVGLDPSNNGGSCPDWAQCDVA
jgi:hypothetical protein